MLIGQRPSGGEYGLVPRTHGLLGQDRGDVVVNGLGGDVHALGDIDVSQARGQQAQHVDLSRRETRRVVQCGPPWSAGYVAHAQFPEPARLHLGGWPDAEPAQLRVRRQLVVRSLAIGQGNGGLVRAAELCPGSGGGVRLAAQVVAFADLGVVPVV